MGSWEEILSHFRFIEKDIDVSKIVSEIDPNDWDVAGTIKGAGGDLTPYGFLPLTMAVIDNEGDDPKNTEKQQNTPMFHRYKEIRRWLKSYKLHRHSRAAFFRLKPGDTVGSHIDDGTYYLTRDRYHLSLQGRYEYWVEDEMHIIEPGTFFWFDNKRYHAAKNISDVDRLTFVFDVPKSKKNP